MNKIYFAVCDDDEITCDVVCRRIFAIFKKCGIEASGAKYFSSATLYNHIAYSREGEAYKYDLVFLDIDMPKYSGMDVAEEIRKKSADTDIIFVSNREDRVFETFSVQPFGFIRKNCFTEGLNATLRQYIQKKARTGKSSCRSHQQQLVHAQTGRVSHSVCGEYGRPPAHEAGQRRKGGRKNDARRNRRKISLLRHRARA